MSITKDRDIKAQTLCRKQHISERRKITDTTKRLVVATILQNINRIEEPNPYLKRRCQMKKKVPAGVKRKKMNEELLAGLHTRLAKTFGYPYADKTLEIMVRELGGHRIVVPDMEYLNRRVRNELIERNFHGNNTNELAVRFNMSEMNIRRVIRSVRAYQKSCDLNSKSGDNK